MQSYTMPVTNGVYIFDVGNFSDSNLPYHQLTLSFSSLPSDGYMKVEVQVGGDSDWVRVPEAGAIYLGEGSRVQFVAPVSKYRFTLSGVVDGAGKTVTVRIYDLNHWIGAMPPEGLYEGTRAETVQTYLEANVKNGVQFEASSEVLALAAGASVNVIFKTTSKPCLIKSRQIVFTGSKVTARVYKNSVYTGGTAIPVYNLSDINPTATTVSVLSGATVSNVGTELAAPTYAYGTNTGGGNVVGTYTVSGLERNLARNRTYLLRLTNNDTQPCNVASYITWYEGNPDLPRGV